MVGRWNGEGHEAAKRQSSLGRPRHSDSSDNCADCLDESLALAKVVRPAKKAIARTRGVGISAMLRIPMMCGYPMTKQLDHFKNISCGSCPTVFLQLNSRSLCRDHT